MPSAVLMPATMSMIGTPTRYMLSASAPVTDISPMMPCATWSSPGAWLSGPVAPKPLTEAMMIPGLALRSASGSRPMTASTPGRKFSTTTSDPTAICHSSSLPPGV